MKKQKKMITKSIKFCPDKLKKAKQKGIIKDLAANCRALLDKMLLDSEKNTLAK